MVRMFLILVISITAFGFQHFYKYIPGKGYLLYLRLNWKCYREEKLVFLFLSQDGKVYRKSYICKRDNKRIFLKKLFKTKFQGKVLIFEPQTLDVFDLGTILEDKE